VSDRKSQPPQKAFANRSNLVGTDGLYKYFPLKKALPTVRTFIADNSIHFTMQPHDDVEWDTLIPGDGLVYLGPDKQPYTVSVVHQLRCIDIARRGIYDVAMHPENSAKHPTPLENHCVNYLRQMIQCRADLELDPVAGRPFPNVHPESYECADWDQLLDAIQENQSAAQ